jgi:hypothetical protein
MSGIRVPSQPVCPPDGEQGLELVHSSLLTAPLTPPTETGGVSLQGLGELTLLDTKLSGAKDGKYPEREHHLYSTELDGTKHVFWHTEAMTDDPDSTVVFVKPGLGEVMEDGIGWKHHKHLARKMPAAEIVSHATFGIGPHGAELTAGDLRGHGTSQMARQETELLKAYWAKRRTILVGTSMGTVINHKVAFDNIEADDPLHIAGLVHYAPAIVVPERILKDMVVSFMPDMIIDGARELFRRTHVKHFLGTMAVLANSKPRKRDLLVMARQGIDLMTGVPEEEIRRVVAHYMVGVVVGYDDPVGQIKMWDELNPNRVWPVRGGHGIALKPFDGASKVSNVIREMGFYVGQPQLKIA